MPIQNELINLPACLEQVKIKALPNNAYYISDFITEAEEAVIFDKVSPRYQVVAAAPKPRWKVLAHRRLQTWPSNLQNDVLLDSSLPQWLIEPVVSRILTIPVEENDSARNIFSESPHHKPNHVLINEYLPGQGIMPHKDGAAYYPVVCTVSLGSSLCLDIYSSNDDGTRETFPRWRILQEPRSLLITTDELYTEYQHGIAEVRTEASLSQGTVANWSLLRSPNQFLDGTMERQVRLSLTYRDVLKVSKFGTNFGMLGKR